MRFNQQQFVLDSSLLIVYLRGDERASRLLAQIAPPYISTLTAAELFAGAVTKEHEQAVDKLLEQTQLMYVNLQIARNAADLICKHPDFFGKKILHSVIDAFIVATGIYLNKTVLTLDLRHFSKFKPKNIHIISFKRNTKIWRFHDNDTY